MRVTFGLRLDEQQGPSSQDFFCAPRVGRQAFLGLLETYLGLSGPDRPHAERVATYMGFLAAAQATASRFYSRSFAADSVGTAARLLEWRDEWSLGGWDGHALDTSPQRLGDMAAVEALAEVGGLAAGEGERLKAVARELQAGSRVPVTSVQLVDDLALFPTAWQRVLAQLPVEAAPALTGIADGDLGRLQSLAVAAVEAGLVSKKLVLENDRSIEVVQARSREVAEHWMSAVCCATPTDRLILCEEGGDALDATLSVTGHPTCGFAAASNLRPALQSMGLAFETCWTPIDVPQLVEFLVHPIGPFSAKARRFLAEALALEPGIGGKAWVDGKEKVRKEEHAAALLDEVEFWLEGERWERDAGAPVAALLARADRVDQAFKRLATSNDANTVGVGPALHQSEAVLAGLREFQRQGTERLTRRQIEQLLSQATPGGASSPYAVSQVGCLKFAVVAATCGLEQADEVVWWMPSTPSLPQPLPWSAREVAALADVGVRLRNPEKELTALTSQWLRPLLAARKRFVLVLPPSGKEEHPVWQLLKQIAPKLTVRSLEDTLRNQSGGLSMKLESLALVTADERIQLGMPVESRRTEQSFSSVKDMFFNPALAVLKDVAALKTSSVLEAADGNRLLGTLGHRVIEELFSVNGAVGWTSAQAGAWFDGMVGTLLEEEGAPLLMPGASVQLHRFKETTRRALIKLLAHLQTAGAMLVHTELELAGTFAGEPFTGNIDLVVTLTDGRKVVLDLKWKGASGYRKVLIGGKHLQLALYASLVNEKFNAMPATVGYFVFEGAALMVTHPDVLPSAEVVQPKSGVTLPELVVLAAATWRWRSEQWARGEIDWVDERFGKLKDFAGPEGTLAMEESGYFDGDHLVLLGGWEQ